MAALNELAFTSTSPASSTEQPEAPANSTEQSQALASCTEQSQAPASSTEQSQAPESSTEQSQAPLTLKDFHEIFPEQLLEVKFKPDKSTKFEFMTRGRNEIAPLTEKDLKFQDLGIYLDLDEFLNKTYRMFIADEAKIKQIISTIPAEWKFLEMFVDTKKTTGNFFLPSQKIQFTQTLDSELEKHLKTLKKIVGKTDLDTRLVRLMYMCSELNEMQDIFVSGYLFMSMIVAMKRFFKFYKEEEEKWKHIDGYKTIAEYFHYLMTTVKFSGVILTKQEFVTMFNPMTHKNNSMICMMLSRNIRNFVVCENGRQVDVLIEVSGDHNHPVYTYCEKYIDSKLANNPRVCLAYDVSSYRQQINQGKKHLQSCETLFGILEFGSRTDGVQEKKAGKDKRTPEYESRPRSENQEKIIRENRMDEESPWFKTLIYKSDEEYAWMEISPGITDEIMLRKSLAVRLYNVIGQITFPEGTRFQLIRHEGKKAIFNLATAMTADINRRRHTVKESLKSEYLQQQKKELDETYKKRQNSDFLQLVDLIDRPDAKSFFDRIRNGEDVGKVLEEVDRKRNGVQKLSKRNLSTYESLNTELLKIKQDYKTKIDKLAHSDNYFVFEISFKLIKQLCREQSICWIIDHDEFESHVAVDPEDANSDEGEGDDDGLIQALAQNKRRRIEEGQVDVHGKDRKREEESDSDDDSYEPDESDDDDESEYSGEESESEVSSTKLARSAATSKD